MDPGVSADREWARRKKITHDGRGPGSDRRALAYQRPSRSIMRRRSPRTRSKDCGYQPGVKLDFTHPGKHIVHTARSVSVVRHPNQSASQEWHGRNVPMCIGRPYPLAVLWFSIGEKRPTAVGQEPSLTPLL